MNMTQSFPISVSDELAVTVPDGCAVLTPAQGLDLAELLARKSFRRALDEEAALDQRAFRSGTREEATQSNSNGGVADERRT